MPDPSVPFLGVHFTPTMGSVTTAANRQVPLYLSPSLPPSLESNMQGGMMSMTYQLAYELCHARLASSARVPQAARASLTSCVVQSNIFHGSFSVLVLSLFVFLFRSLFRSFSLCHALSLSHARALAHDIAY